MPSLRVYAASSLFIFYECSFETGFLHLFFSTSLKRLAFGCRLDQCFIVNLSKAYVILNLSMPFLPHRFYLDVGD